MYGITTATKKIQKLKKRLRAVCGGTSASKTISIILYLITLAQEDEKPTLASIVSESFPHLKRGAIKDFLHIMQAHNLYDENRWNRGDFTYTFESGSKIEFFSADQPGKVRGPRRERLFINEANNIPYETFDQLEIRTKEFIFLDWNPTNEFWFYTDILDTRDDYDFITLTYLDNEGLADSIIKSIEQRKGNVGWWKVYGLGQLGEVEGKIYSNWQIIDEIPHEARLMARGMDFGYSIDPTAIEDIYNYNGGFIIDERLYQKNVGNKALADTLLAFEEPHTIVRADGAEPKSIDEIYSYGVNIVAASKGPGSVLPGIKYVQDQKISVTKKSLNTIKAYRNYMFTIDNRTGKIIQKPDDSVHEWSNSMDAIRYGFDAAHQQQLFDGNHKTNY